ncbi:MAG: DUF5717 family protein [Clostridiales bacterium]|jgi:hypothetical protein|nr:DUF5717 family protein [Clostridiales bacterium]
MTLADLEQQFDKTPSTRRALFIAMAYWLNGKLNPDNAEMAFQRSFYTIKTARARLGQNPRLLCATAFISIEMGNEDMASESIDTLSEGRNYYRGANTRIYKQFVFLSALLEARKGKLKRARRYINQFKEYNATHANPRDDLLCEGILEYELGEYETSYQCLLKAFKYGNCSTFLYVWLLINFSANEGGDFHRDAELNASFIRWGLVHGADMRKCIDRLGVNLPPDFYRLPLWRERLAKRYPQNYLRQICQNLMSDMNYSAAAYGYYSQADVMRLELPDLYHFILKSALRSHIETVSAHALQQYLDDPDDEDEVVAFAYHLVLIEKKLAPLLNIKRDELLQFTSHCLERAHKGRHFYTLYAHYIVMGSEWTLPDSHMDKAQDLLGSVLFSFRIRTTDNSAKSIYIFEKERTGMSVYKLTNGSVLIEAHDAYFARYALTADERQALDSVLKVTRLVNFSDVRLYEYFYNKGSRRFPLMCALSRHAMNAKTPPSWAIEVLSQTLNMREVSHMFANQIRVALGRMLYESGDPNEAMRYFIEADDSLLPDIYIEEILGAFIAARNWDQAARLLAARHESVSDKTLFAALKQLCRHSAYHFAIAEPAFRLLAKAWYDKTLLRVVVKHYKGLQKEWQELSRVLASISIIDKDLDSLILKNAVFIREMSDGAQGVFIRGACDHESTRKFTYFCIYEIIVNNFKPMYETIPHLEKIYMENNEPQLAYALSHAYLSHGIVTARRAGIIDDAVRCMRAEDILFPVIKENKDKLSSLPYIEKNQPFLYKGLPDKNIFLLYKIDNEPSWHKRRMKYWRFGLYLLHIPVFYNETIRYYYSNETAAGSVTTHEAEIKSMAMFANPDQSDPYCVINNAVIYEQMFQYDKAEEELTQYLKSRPSINASIL